MSASMTARAGEAASPSSSTPSSPPATANRRSLIPAPLGDGSNGCPERPDHLNGPYPSPPSAPPGPLLPGAVGRRLDLAEAPLQQQLFLVARRRGQGLRQR